MKMAEDRVDLVTSQDDRQALRPLGANDAVDVPQFLPQNDAIKEKKGAQRLVLRRSAHPPPRCEVGQERGDLRLAHLVRMGLAVEAKKPQNPVGIGFPRICELRP